MSPLPLQCPSRAGMFSLLVVSDQAYYNVAVQAFHMLYVVQPCLEPLTLTLCQWDRALRLYSWSYVCARSNTRGA